MAEGWWKKINKAEAKKNEGEERVRREIMWK
jgi:hypothetical protein